ncbi:hypothetical protein [Cryobacterium sp. Y11]|nr:hypothetical protein [Cryobacterium sp. Y11]
MHFLNVDLGVPLWVTTAAFAIALVAVTNFVFHLNAGASGSPTS